MKKSILFLLFLGAMVFGQSGSRENVSGTSYDRIKICWGAAGAITCADTASGKGLPVTVTSTTGKTAADSGVNVAKINGVVPLMGAGNGGTGSLRVNIATDQAGFPVGNTQASTTSGQSGPLVQGAVTTAAPTYTTGQTNPLSLTTGGALRTTLSGTNDVNLAQVAGTTTVNGGLAGTQSVGGTAASNAAITQNPLLMAGEALSTQPAAATTGRQRNLVVSLDGAAYTRTGGPISWSCSLDNLGATLTECQAAPGAGLKLYITSITAQSTTATGGLFLLQNGTGTNCGTGTASLYPSAASVPRFTYTGNAVVGTSQSFPVPLVVPANNALCILATAVNTGTFQIVGFTAP